MGGIELQDAKATVRGTANDGTAVPVSVRVLRSVSEIEEVRDAWMQMQRHPNADMDFFLSVVDSRPEILRPHVLVLSRDGRPAAILVGRIEDSFLEAKLGYKVIHRWPVRCLTFVYRGLLGDSSAANSAALMKAAINCLADREADVIWFNSLRSDTPIYRIARRACGLLFSDYFPELNLHWRASLPGSYEQFLQTLSSNTRHNLRRYSSRLLKTFGRDLSVRCFRQRTELDQIIDDTEFVAAKTYHRGLGVGFVDSAQTRRLTALALERNWFRAYILYIRGVPSAFWNGLQYGRTFFTGATGSDPAYSEHRLGTFLLTRVFEDLCQNDAADEIDFGFGDAQYKRDLCDQSWQEASMYVFAPTVRGLVLNAVRTPTILIDRASRKALERTKLLEKVKRAWRNRLRKGETHVLR